MSIRWTKKKKDQIIKQTAFCGT